MFLSPWIFFLLTDTVYKSNIYVASFLRSTSITTNKPELYGSTRTNHFYLSCLNTWTTYVLWKMCNYWFSVVFFLFFNFYCQVVSCACCSLTGFFSHLKKSSKSEHKAFAFKQSKIRFCLCLIHHISCMSMFGTGQKYEIPHGKLCLPSNCYLNASCSLIVENTL